MSQRKILIFSCNGGGGHISAAAAIKGYLGDLYSVCSIDAVGDLLLPLDPLYYITFKHYSGQDLYNFLLVHNKKRIINFLSTIGKTLIALQRKFVYRAFLAYLKKEQPNLIISVIPLINVMLKDAASTLNIPLIIIPTDLDGTTFISNITLQDHDKLHIGLGFDYPEVIATLASPNNYSNLESIGFPIRASFFEPKDIALLKKQYGVASHSRVLMLIMGATGSIAIMEYVKILVKIDFPLHIMICIGRNDRLKKFITDFIFPAHITYMLVDNSIDISNVMAISDLCITKPGSCTFAECLYMQLPMLIDNTSFFLNWEKFNALFLQKHSLGEIVTTYSQAKDLVKRYFLEEHWRNAIKKNMQAIKRKNFKQEFPILIEKILA